MTFNKILWLFAVAIFTCLLAIRFFLPQWKYVLGIDENGIIVSEVPVNNLNKDFRGADIKSLDLDRTNPGQLLAFEERRIYLTADHGKTWKLLQHPSGNIDSALWINGSLIALVSTDNRQRLQVSDDLGKSWQSLANASHFANYFFLELQRNTAGQPLIIASLAPQAAEEAYLLQNAAEQITFLPCPNTFCKDTQRYSHHLKIHLQKGTISANTFQATDGTWAATPGGIFFQCKDSLVWQDKSASLHAPHLKAIKKCPGNNNLLLTYDTIGRLWISHNQGKSWSATPAVEVASAIFLSKTSILLVHLDDSLEILENNELREIPADWDRTGIRKRLMDQTTQPGSLKKTAPTSKTAHSITREDNHFILDHTPLPQTRLLGYITQAKLFGNGSRFLLASDSVLQIGKLKAYKPVGIPRVWKLDDIAINNNSLFLSSPDKIEVLTPNGFRGGLDFFHIELKSPHFYKIMLYLFYFRYGAMVVFLALCAWLFVIKHPPSSSTLNRFHWR